MGDSSETKFCSNCKRDIATSNYVMHEVHCRRHVVLCEHCDEPVARSEMDSHFEEYHAPQACSMCSQQFEISKIEKHKEEECPKRPGKCEFCEIQMARDDLVEHEEYCGARTEPCPLCQQYIMIKVFERHSSSGCTYPPRKQNAPKNTNGPDMDYDPNVLLPDELYNTFAMDEMSRILNSEVAPTGGIPGYQSRNLADGAIERSRPPQAAAVTDGASRRKKPSPRQPMNRRQPNVTQSSRNASTERNLRKRTNPQQRELNHLQAKPNNLQTSNVRPSNVRPSRNSWGDDDLDELLARHLAQDLSSGPKDHSHNLLSSETVDDEFALPCEICGELFPSEHLIQHQGMCAVGASDHFNIPSSHSADDILGAGHAAHSPEHVLPSRRTLDDDLFSAAQQVTTLNNRTQRRRQPSPPIEVDMLDNFSNEIHTEIDDNLDFEEHTMLPCEFCDNLFPGDSLVQHQVVCDANDEGDQLNVTEARPRLANTQVGPTSNSFRQQDGLQRTVSSQQKNSPAVSRYGLNNGGAFGGLSSSSLIKKDKDNKARQNLITKQSDRPIRSDLLSGDALSDSRLRRRQGGQNGGAAAAASYQPSFGIPVRTAPKLVNKARKQSQGEDRNFMVTGSQSNRTEETSTNGISRVGTRPTNQTRTSANKLTNSTRPRRFPQGDA